MTHKQVIRALIKDYEMAIEEGWGKVELWDKSMLFGICFAASLFGSAMFGTCC